MSLSHDQVLQLMAYADDELDGDERAAVEALLARDEDARGVVVAMSGSAVSAVGEWVARTHEDRAVAAGADSIADAVMARVAESATRADGVRAEPRELSSLDAARERRARRMQTGGALIAIAAMAAGVLFYVGSQSGPTQATGGPLASMAPSEPETARPPTPSADPEQVAVGAGTVQVNEIDSPSHDVSVYEIPAAAAAANMNSAASVIIWIGDDSPQPKGK
jgi:hypothetical protein